MLANVQNVAAGFGILSLSIFFLLPVLARTTQGPIKRNLTLECAGSAIGRGLASGSLLPSRYRADGGGSDALASYGGTSWSGCGERAIRGRYRYGRLCAIAPVRQILSDCNVLCDLRCGSRVPFCLG